MTRLLAKEPLHTATASWSYQPKKRRTPRAVRLSQLAAERRKVERAKYRALALMTELCASSSAEAWALYFGSPVYAAAMRTLRGTR